MAKTVRKVNAVAKEVKAIEAPKEVNIVTKVKDVLDASHLLQLETKTRDVETYRLLCSVEEQFLRNLLLEQQLLVVKIEKQRALLKEKSFQYEGSKKKLATFQKEIWPEYGFKENEGLGYDPLTGEIKR